MLPRKWDNRFLELAELVSTWSKDPSTKVGAVIVRPDKTIASVGFNGFPIYSEDRDEDYDNREGVKYSKIIHAEMNAILFARERLQGYTLYVHPLLCCDRCAVHVIQAGISRVVARQCPEDKRPRWEPVLLKSQEYFAEAGVEVTLY